MKFQCNIFDGKIIQRPNIIDDILSMTKYNLTVAQFKSLENKIGSVLEEGKIGCGLKYSADDTVGFTVELEQELAKIKNKVSESIYASVTFYPKIKKEVLDDFKNALQKASESSAKAIVFGVGVLIVGILTGWVSIPLEGLLIAITPLIGRFA